MQGDRLKKSVNRVARKGRNAEPQAQSMDATGLQLGEAVRFFTNSTDRSMNSPGIGWAKQFALVSLDLTLTAGGNCSLWIALLTNEDID